MLHPSHPFRSPEGSELSGLPRFSAERNFKKALFLVSLTTGLCASQLYDQTHHIARTIFAQDGSRVPLTPFAKNECEDYSLYLFIIPALIEHGQPLFLSFMSALQQYLEATSQAPCDHLLVWPTSLSLCTEKHIGQVVCKIIDSMDPGKHPTSWDIQRVGASHNYLTLLFGEAHFSV